MVMILTFGCLTSKSINSRNDRTEEVPEIRMFGTGTPSP